VPSERPRVALAAAAPAVAERCAKVRGRGSRASGGALAVTLGALFRRLDAPAHKPAGGKAPAGEGVVSREGVTL